MESRFAASPNAEFFNKIRQYRSYRTRGVRVLRGPLFAQAIHRLDINVILSDPLKDRSGF
jgi:hypothetical protein